MKKKKRGKKKFSLKKEYRECWSYLKDSRKFIYAIIGIFLGFVILGFFVPAPAYLIEKIMEFIEEILLKPEDLSTFQMMKFIFFNNLQSSFLGMVLGVLLGIFPILAAISNGYILGFVSALSVSNGGVFSLWRLLPHGIFEFPAIFISLGLGLKLGSWMFKKDKRKFFREIILKSLKTFLYVILPLLIMAGIIEGILIGMSW